MSWLKEQMQIFEKNILSTYLQAEEKGGCMNELQIFNNPDFGDIRTLEENGMVLFCASDVAKALGYARPNDAISQHCRATVKRSTPISGKMQDINFIPRV